MILEKYNGTHNESLGAILKLRDMNTQDLPQLGYCVYLERTEEPVAFGFLRLCEGNYAIFDGLITNPNINGEFRNEALDMITGALLTEAKSLNIKQIIGWASDKHTLMRASKFGFSCLNQTLICKRV